MPKSLREQIDGKCKHFTGTINDQCAAGVEYATVRGPADERPYRIACFRDDQFKTGKPLPECSRRCWRTPEEVDAEVAESRAAIQKMLDDVAAGRCHVCGKPAEPSRISGRCKYAACGHRIGQVG